MTLEVLRDGDREQVEVTLGERPDRLASGLSRPGVNSSNRRDM